jgi:hypothetical protein
MAVPHRGSFPFEIAPLLRGKCAMTGIVPRPCERRPQMRCLRGVGHNFPDDQRFSTIVELKRAHGLPRCVTDCRRHRGLHSTNDTLPVLDIQNCPVGGYLPTRHSADPIAVRFD